MSYGIAVGVVDKTDDPESLGRVQVRIPIIAEFVRWARVVRPAAEANFLAPAVGDEVLIAGRRSSVLWCPVHSKVNPTVGLTAIAQSLRNQYALAPPMPAISQRSSSKENGTAQKTGRSLKSHSHQANESGTGKLAV
jgi:hypothetical protein